MTDPTIITVNPATGIELAEYATFDAQQIDSVVAAVHQAESAWASTAVEQRVEHLRVLAKHLRADRVELAALMTNEMGKPVTEAQAEIEKCAWVCEYYADIAAAELADQEVVTERMSWVGFEPLGTILAIMPWNFPYWQVFRFAAPALAAGNTVLLKHSPNVTGCALAIEQLMLRAGLPRNTFRTLVVAESDVVDVTGRLVGDDRVAAVTVTGSERAGTSVAAVAGKHAKPTVLELGGSDPFVVLEDADLELALAGGLASRFLNAGQSCLAAKRFIVNHSLVDEFTELLAVRVKSLVIGDPSSPDTQIGPLARRDLRDQLHGQVQRAVEAGAGIVTGGHPLDQPGAWYEPTVLRDLSPDSPVLMEETFGPVAAVTSVANDDEAVTVANRTRFGLGASVWSRDVQRALALGRRIRSGALFINAVVASDPRLPFGGVKHSGYGRELGRSGLKEFVNVRTHVVDASHIR